MNLGLRIAVALLALALGACSSFDRDWRAAAARSAKSGDLFEGAWDGKWTSEKHRLPNGAPSGGRLRCIFTKQDAHHYHARFHANWLCFASGYETDFTTQPRGGALDFQGEQDLGFIFGGIYRYEGHVTPERFLARFACRFDHGIFDMHRPEALAAPRRLTP